ncbi:prolyl 4-hydroxylase subunit alpha-2-like isoform X2 [Drosophila pseudoobscura]|uniref:Prolyl 4-hydroxylase subunit alpha-2-like isoform X2 n=1 Tax=Drosophila pseudoobscura pseudoobscura TaxID=46245 RepID=A0A6I8VNH9_DROPS|nr:prolyl 4-hydroxylase subunit alpha-2 isoform X2 [Drosophila pseudoobscura]
MEQPVGGAQMRSFDAWRDHLPTQLDLQDACNGIARIQDIYGLQEKHIMRGQLAGIKYNMSTGDIFAMGQHLSRTTNAKEVVPWLEEVKRRLRNQTPGPLAVDKAEVLLLLAETYIKSKHYAEALPILDRALKHNIADAVLLRRREEVQQLIAKEPSTVLDNAEPKDNSKVAILKWGCRGFSREQSPKALHCCYNFTTTPFLRLAPPQNGATGGASLCRGLPRRPLRLGDSRDPRNGRAKDGQDIDRGATESDFVADPHSHGAWHRSY